MTAQVLRFIELVKGSPLNVLKVSHGNGPLEAKELDRAETLWIQSIQAQSFEREIRYLGEEHTLGKPPYVDQFCLFLDEHVLRCFDSADDSSRVHQFKSLCVLKYLNLFKSSVILTRDYIYICSSLFFHPRLHPSKAWLEPHASAPVSPAATRQNHQNGMILGEMAYTPLSPRNNQLQHFNHFTSQSLYRYILPAILKLILSRVYC